MLTSEPSAPPTPIHTGLHLRVQTISCTCSCSRHQLTVGPCCTGAHRRGSRSTAASAASGPHLCRPQGCPASENLTCAAGPPPIAAAGSLADLAGSGLSAAGCCLTGAAGLGLSAADWLSAGSCCNAGPASAAAWEASLCSGKLESEAGLPLLLRKLPGTWVRSPAAGPDSVGSSSVVECERALPSSLLPPAAVPWLWDCV